MKKKSTVHYKVSRSRTSSGTQSHHIIPKFLVIALVASFISFFLLAFLSRSGDHFCANSISCIKDLTVRVENSSTGYFEGQVVTPPAIDLAQDLETTRVLGAATGEKHIYVDLSTQKLYAFEGTTQIMDTYIASGKWHPTPPGEYHIWIKLRATRMSGGSGNDAYDLPNVPFVMFFAGGSVSEADGFSLHGAYWHDNFGHPMSHGCVNMRISDAETLYNWADPPTTSTTTLATAKNPGTPISICSSITLQDGSTPECVE